MLFRQMGSEIGWNVSCKSFNRNWSGSFLYDGDLMTATERRTIPVQFDVVLRLADRADLPKLEWGGEYTHFRRVFQRTYEEQLAGQRLMIVADVNNYPIGQVFVQLDSHDDIIFGARKRGYLYSLRVMAAFQHKGIGTALIREAESMLHERGYWTVSIAAAKDNIGARRLYERLGFRVFTEDDGRWHYVDHEGRTRYVVEPCWVLEKNLR
jgi:ribosomal protein S18 acetylase RimI-like enzyme